MNEHPFHVLCTLGLFGVRSSICHACEYCFDLIIEWFMKLSVEREASHILRVLEQGHDFCSQELLFTCSITVVNGQFQQPWSNEGKANCEPRLLENEDLGHPTKQETCSTWSVRQEWGESKMCGGRKTFYPSIKLPWTSNEIIACFIEFCVFNLLQRLQPAITLKMHW